MAIILSKAKAPCSHEGARRFAVRNMDLLSADNAASFGAYGSPLRGEAKDVAFCKIPLKFAIRENHTGGYSEFALDCLCFSTFFSQVLT